MWIALKGPCLMHRACYFWPPEMLPLCQKVHFAVSLLFNGCREGFPKFYWNVPSCSVIGTCFCLPHTDVTFHGISNPSTYSKYCLSSVFQVLVGNVIYRISFELLSNPERLSLLSPLYRLENWGPPRKCMWLRQDHTARVRARIYLSPGGLTPGPVLYHYTSVCEGVVCGTQIL